MADDANTIERGQSVWTHDAVFVPNAPIPRPRMRLLVTAVTVGMIPVSLLLAYAFGWAVMIDSWMLVVFLIVVGPIVDDWWNARVNKRTFDQWRAATSAEVPPTPAQLAMECWMAGFLSRRTCFDVARWLRETGPNGPRVIVLGSPSNEMRSTMPVDVHEEVELSSLSSVSAEVLAERAQRPWKTRAASFGLLAFVAVWAASFWSHGWYGRGMVVFACAAVLWVFLWWLLKPFGVNSTAQIASIGRVVTSGTRGGAEFLREQAVIVVQPKRGDIAKDICPSDGFELTITDTHGRTECFSAEGLNAPLVTEFLGRWSYRRM